jgi:hypothetical protein
MKKHKLALVTASFSMMIIIGMQNISQANTMLDPKDKQQHKITYVFTDNFLSTQKLINSSSLIIGVNKPNFCLLQQKRSSFSVLADLLLRLMIIWSFGTIGTSSYSSWLGYYLKFIPKNLMFISFSIIFLVSLLVMDSIVASSTSRYSNVCRLSIVERVSDFP